MVRKGGGLRARRKEEVFERWWKVFSLMDIINHGFGRGDQDQVPAARPG
jgi:hypothetical protein